MKDGITDFDNISKWGIFFKSLLPLTKFVVFKHWKKYLILPFFIVLIGQVILSTSDAISISIKPTLYNSKDLNLLNSANNQLYEYLKEKLKETSHAFYYIQKNKYSISITFLSRNTPKEKILIVQTISAEYINFLKNYDVELKRVDNKISISAFLLNFLLLFLVEIFIMVLVYSLTNKIYNIKILKLAGYKVLGYLPKIKKYDTWSLRFKWRKKNYSINEYDGLIVPSQSSYRDQLNFLTENILHLDNASVILITSACPNEGKSVTLTNLAIDLSRCGKKVLIFETDLRKPTISKLLGISKKEGLIDFVFGRTSNINEIISPSDIYPNMSLIRTDPIPEYPFTFILSEKFIEILNYAKINYDYIFLDSAPILLVAETVYLSRFCDYAIFISSLGLSTLSQIEEGISRLEIDDPKKYGVVVNNISKFDILSDFLVFGGYGFGRHLGYGYGYY